MDLPEARFWITSELPTNYELTHRLVKTAQSRTQSRVKRRWGQGKETVSETLPIVAGSFRWIRRGWYKTASSNLVVRKALVCSSGCELFFIRNQGTLCCRFDDVSDRLWLRHIYCVAAFHFNDRCTGALRHLPLGIRWNHPVFGRQ